MFSAGPLINFLTEPLYWIVSFSTGTEFENNAKERRNRMLELHLLGERLFWNDRKMENVVADGVRFGRLFGRISFLTLRVFFWAGF